MVRIVSSDRLDQGRVTEALLFRILYLCQKGKHAECGDMLLCESVQ